MPSSLFSYKEVAKMQRRIATDPDRWNHGPIQASMVMMSRDVAGTSATKGTKEVHAGKKKTSNARPLFSPEFTVVVIGAKFVAQDGGYSLLRVAGADVGVNPYIRIDGDEAFLAAKDSMPVTFALRGCNNGRMRGGFRPCVFLRSCPFIMGDCGVHSANCTEHVAFFACDRAPIIVAYLDNESLTIRDKFITDFGAVGLVVELGSTPPSLGASPLEITIFVPLKHYFKEESETGYVGTHVGTTLRPLTEQDWVPTAIVDKTASDDEEVCYDIAKATQVIVPRLLVLGYNADSDSYKVKTAKHFDPVGDPTAQGTQADSVLQLRKHKLHECELVYGSGPRNRGRH
uniref:Uncharacterized protein n=1 Tax=Neobodo designis TaxID=312471 RepID=A0A7S1W270_NEODS